MSKEQFIKLYEKQLRGIATPEEQAMLQQYSDSFMLQEYEWTEEMGNKEAITERIFERIWADMQPEVVQKVKWYKRRLAIAAVFLAVVCTTFMLLYNNEKDQSPMAETPAQQQDIAPGGDKAVLTLGDGSTIVLDQAGNGTITTQGYTQINKVNDGLIAYNNVSHSDLTVSFNSVSTPRGGQYSIVLPDGSKVWLNAASSLKFPTAFKGAERKVELTGEAYFEVAKYTKQPFKVMVNDMEVKVLGTHFNIMAYSDEASIQTTLLEGSVRVTKDAFDVVLKPGQQSQLNSGNSLQVINEVNTESVVAWKNGTFDFVNADIPAIMRQLSRWYNVGIMYKSKIPEGHFTGIVGRANNLSHVLKMLELSGVQFQIKDKQIIVE